MEKELIEIIQEARDASIPKQEDLEENLDTLDNKQLLRLRNIFCNNTDTLIEINYDSPCSMNYNKNSLLVDKQKIFIKEPVKEIKRKGYNLFLEGDYFKINVDIAEVYSIKRRKGRCYLEFGDIFNGYQDNFFKISVGLK